MGPMYTGGLIYVCLLMSVCLLTLADEDAISIPIDETNRTTLSNVTMQVAQHVEQKGVH